MDTIGELSAQVYWEVRRLMGDEDQVAQGQGQGQSQGQAQGQSQGQAQGQSRDQAQGSQGQAQGGGRGAASAASVQRSGSSASSKSAKASKVRPCGRAWLEFRPRQPPYRWIHPETYLCTCLPCALPPPGLCKQRACLQPSVRRATSC